jgi:DnaJ-domain-containing protein 1
MDASTYYINTLTTAFQKLAPIIAWALAGYFIFIRLPFLLFLKNMKDSKLTGPQELQLEDDEATKRKKEQDNVNDFNRRMKILGGASQNEQKKSEKKTEQKTEQKKEQRKEQRKEESKKRPSPSKDASAENLFELRPGQNFTKDELRKKYHELLKMNHPDKVASLGQDFKKLAEQKTKDINSAYNKLKSRAS